MSLSPAAVGPASAGDGVAANAPRTGPLARLRAVVANSDLAFLVVVSLVFAMLSPWGTRAEGLIGGGIIALQAIAVALVLRTNRLVNFAQLAVGQACGLLFYELDRHSQFAWFAQQLCSGCFPGISQDGTFTQSHPDAYTSSLVAHHFGLWLQVNFWLSLVVCLALAAGLSWLIYFVVIARLNRAPRLVATIATIAVAEFIAAIAGYLPAGIFQDQLSTGNGPFYLPFRDVQVTIPQTIFHLGDIFFVCAFILTSVGLVVFLRRSRTGIAIRSSSDNPQRAATLGINVNAVSGIVWLLAGLLGGVASVLGELSSAGGTPGITAPSLSLTELVRIMAALVFARLTNLPKAMGAALLLGVIATGSAWTFSSSNVFDGMLLLLIGGGLLLQRHRTSRADDDANTSFLSAREARPIPGELRDVPVVRGWVRTLGAVVVIVALGFPFVMSPSQVSLGSTVLLFAIVGLSLLVLTGWAGQISLGQWAFAAVGAYLAGLLAGHGLPMLACLAGGAIGGGVVALIVGIPALRLRGTYLAISTLAFAVAMTSLVMNPSYGGRLLPPSVDRPVLLGLDMNDEKVFFYFCLVLLALCVGAVVGMRRSRTARALIAARDNEGAAQSFGIDLIRARLAAFAISGFLAALAGAAFAYQEHGVLAPSYLPDQSITLFLMVVIGGLGSVAGPLIGATYQGILVLFSDPVVQLLGTGGGVLIVLLLFPGGLSAAALRVRDNMLRRVAARNRITVPSLTAGLLKAGQEDRAPILPRTGPGGTQAFVPERYLLARQWEHFRERRHG